MCNSIMKDFLKQFDDVDNKKIVFIIHKHDFKKIKNIIYPHKNKTVIVGYGSRKFFKVQSIYRFINLQYIPFQKYVEIPETYRLFIAEFYNYVDNLNEVLTNLIILEKYKIINYADAINKRERTYKLLKTYFNILHKLNKQLNRKGII